MADLGTAKGSTDGFSFLEQTIAIADIQVIGNNGGTYFLDITAETRPEVCELYSYKKTLATPGQRIYGTYIPFP